MKKFLALLLFPITAFAQTPISSIRNFVDSEVLYGITVTPLDGNSQPLTALSQDWPAGAFQNLTTLTFPASPTPYTLTGYRVAIVVTGTGFVQELDLATGKPRPFILNVTTALFAVPFGVQLVGTITAPLSGTGTVMSGLGLDTMPPTSPGLLVATPIGASAVNLTWSPATDNVGVSFYSIERCLGQGCTIGFTQIASPISQPTFVDGALAPNTVYNYRVRAADAAGNVGGYSNVAVATTQALPPVVVPPPPTGTSPDHALLPPAKSLTTPDGAIWTFNGTHPMRNGAETGGSGGVLMTIKAGVIYFQQGPLGTGQWWRRVGTTGTGWSPVAAPF